ncbi:MAG: hypothetical protein AB1768_14905 [Pseudomonadota bacterium]|jgi:hypothetical protein
MKSTRRLVVFLGAAGLAAVHMVQGRFASAAELLEQGFYFHSSTA